MKIASSQLLLTSQSANWERSSTRSHSIPLSGSMASSPLRPHVDKAESPPQTDKAQPDDLLNDPRLAPLIRLIEDITGKPVRVFSGQLYKQPNDVTQSLAPSASLPPSQDDSIQTQESWSLIAFSAAGRITTSSGLQLDIQLDFSIEQYQFTQIDRQTENKPPKDPLLLNLGKGPIGLSSRTVEIDLNQDGLADKLPMPEPGAGYLVADRDGDNQVSNTELLGSSTGQAFAELAAMDNDRNGWIDENDAAFSQLKVWMQSDNGRLLLKGLKDAGIGALSVTSTYSPFNIKDNQNNTMAMVQQSGFFLLESGQALNMHQIDLLA